MKIKSLTITLVALTVSSILSSCKKEGLGGENIIVAMPEHHGVAIKVGTVYIKYGAKESPGKNASDYDAQENVVSHPGEAPHAHFEELVKGDYYLYFAGFDSTIMLPVFGGIPVELTKKSGETEVKVPVVE